MEEGDTMLVRLHEGGLKGGGGRGGHAFTSLVGLKVGPNPSDLVESSWNSLNDDLL